MRGVGGVIAALMELKDVLIGVHGDESERGVRPPVYVDRLYAGRMETLTCVRQKA